MSIFRLYDENGQNNLGFLPDAISWGVGVEFNEVGALQMEYARDGVNADQLAPLREIAFCDSDGDELPNGRFIIQTIKSDETDKSVLSITAKSFISYLETALAYPAGNYYASTINRTYTNQTPGYILNRLIDDAQTRGALTFLTRNFSDVADSASVSWPTTTTLEVDARLSILSIMRGLSDQGLIEFVCNGHQLSAYIGNTYGVDRTLQATPLVLNPGLSITEAPLQLDASSLATAALIIGEDYNRGEATSPTGITTYGRREVSVSASGVNTMFEANNIANQIVTNSSAPTKQLTLGLALAGNAPKPFQDFFPGDYVYYRSTTGVERLRVRQLTLSMDGSGEVSSTTILGDRIYENSVRLAQTLNRLTANSRQVGTGSTPEPPVEATVQPNAVLVAPLEQVSVFNDGPPPTTIYIDAINAAVNDYPGGNPDSDYIIKIRGDENNTLNSIMEVGTAITVVAIVYTGGTGYYLNEVAIDDQNPYIYWLGGINASQPNEPMAAIAYTFTIIKIDDAAFDVLGSIAVYK